MHFTCPYCQTAQVVQDAQRHKSMHRIYVDKNIEGKIAFHIHAIACANPDCAKTLIEGFLTPVGTKLSGEISSVGPIIEKWALRPQGLARPLPDFIPQPIMEDYTEACRIRDLSPKASATLIRRCLQGMIRDFCGISKDTLYQEIITLKKKIDDGTAPKGVSEESVEAIDRIRGIGNIGAHMEKDIDLIIPVDANEAQLLIDLTEMLFDEWYISRAKREARLAALKEVADSKKDLKVAQLPSPEAEVPRLERRDPPATS